MTAVRQIDWKSIQGSQTQKFPVRSISGRADVRLQVADLGAAQPWPDTTERRTRHPIEIKILHWLFQHPGVNLYYGYAE